MLSTHFCRSLYRRGRGAVLAAGLASLVLSISGCLMVGPDYFAPQAEAPDAWEYGLRKQTAPRSDKLATWWEGFGDKYLAELIGKARVENPGLEIALERVVEARAQRGVAYSALFPQAGASGEYTRSRTSESLLVPVPQNPSNFFAAGFDSGWEIDVFGGNRRGVEAAQAGLEGSVESFRDALVTLYGEVASNYIEARTLEERLRLARENIKRQKASLELTRDRFEAGLAPELDVTQAESNVYISEALIPALEQQLTFTRNRIAALLGGYPGSQDGILKKSAGIPVPGNAFGYGLPVDLVRSRPDIRLAERNLAAQSALIGVATADLYPRFSLFGAFEWQAADASDWFSSPSRAWGFGPSFSWNIFTAGAIRNNIRTEESRTRQALVSYENSVILAVEEVEDAMVAIARERERLGKLGDAVEASLKTVELVKANYTAGLVDFQNVLDAERTLFNVQDEEATSRGQVSNNYVSLYKALGGGAEVDEVPREILEKMDEEAAKKPFSNLKKKLKGEENSVPEAEAPIDAADVADEVNAGRED